MSQDRTIEPQYARIANAATQGALRASPSRPPTDVPASSNADRFNLARSLSEETGLPPDVDGTPTTPASSLYATHHAPNTTAPTSLLRQMRARMAFKRSSTRLYEAFLDKFDATADASRRSQRGSLNRNTLVRFRNEEAAHFELLCESLECMGVDPMDALNHDNAGSPPAHDPRSLTADGVDTTEALGTLLDAEQVDEAGWQHLVATAHACGLDDLAHRFEQAHSEEIGHVRQLRAWLAILPPTRRMTVRRAGAESAR